MSSESPWLASYPKEIRYDITYPNVSLPNLLEMATKDNPDGIAIRFYDKKITYMQFSARVNQFANALIQQGVKKGDRVALMSPNAPQWLIAFYGTLKTGAVIVQTNPMYVERELGDLVIDSGAETIVIYEPLYPKAKAILNRTPLKRIIVFNFGPSEIEEDENTFIMDDLIKDQPYTSTQVPIDPSHDTALLQYTGGTTGVSKGVMLTHLNLIANAFQTKEYFLPLCEEDTTKEIVMSVLPFFHVYGMTVSMNLAIALKCTQIILPRFEPKEIVETVQRLKPTFFPAAPTMYIAINNFPDVENYDLTSIKASISGSAPLPVPTQIEFERLTGSIVVEGYGLSEASPVTNCNPTVGKRKMGSIGLPFPNTECKIVDAETGTKELPPEEAGELAVKGPQVMKGYWNMPEETSKVLRNGWLLTGDIAKMDEEGFFYILDRKKDMVIASGFKIYPREVEDILATHPKIRESVAVGVPDPYRGETLKAYIVLKDGVSANPEEIVDYCRERLAAYKVPRLVEIREELPKTFVGKVLRRVLREEHINKSGNPE